MAALLFKKIDIVHVHMASRSSFYRKKIIIDLSKLFKKKVIIHLHGGEFHIFYGEESNERQKAVIRKTFDKADEIIALSEEWRNRIKEITNTNVTVVYNPVIPPLVSAYKPENKEILFMGKMVKGKGIYDIIEITKDVITKYPSYKFVLCGNGEYKNVKKIVENRRIDEHVILHEWIEGEEKKRAFENAVVFLLPSYNECMPMSILEALSYGIPVIATKVGGVPEIITNNKNGILIEAGDVKSLRDNLIYLLDNIELRRQLSANAYKIVREKFDIYNNINLISSVYFRVSHKSNC